MTLTSRIHTLLDPYDSSHTECDGMTQICHTVLMKHIIKLKHIIKHQPMAGTLARPTHNQMIPIHFWIDLPDGYKIDYRARMWLGDNSIPYGVFHPQEFPDIVYTGAPIELQPLPPVVVEILIPILHEDAPK